MRFLQKLLSNRFYKLLFYLLPLVLVCYLLINTYYSKYKDENNVKQKVYFVKKEKSIELFDFVKDLEKKIGENSLEVKNLKIASNSVFVDIEGDFVSSIEIIDFVEKYSHYLDIKKISFRALSANKIDLNLEVVLTKNLNYYKNKIAKEFTDNILYQENAGTIQKDSIENKQMKIFAIIDNSVLINNTWYKVGNFINDKKIVLIKSDHIALEQEGNIKKVWMYDNEFTR